MILFELQLGLEVLVLHQDLRMSNGYELTTRMLLGLGKGWWSVVRFFTLFLVLEQKNNYSFGLLGTRLYTTFIVKKQWAEIKVYDLFR